MILKTERIPVMSILGYLMAVGTNIFHVLNRIIFKAEDYAQLCCVYLESYYDISWKGGV